MTGYTVHTGSNQKFIAGWDQIFQGTASTKKSTAGTTAKKKVATKAAVPVKLKKKTAATKLAAKDSRRSQ